MHKIWILFKREYKASVKTKSFIISIILVPIMMAGGLIAVVIMEKNNDTTDKNFVVIDHSGLVKDVLENAAEERNSKDIFDPETGEKVDAAFHLEFVQPDTVHPMEQKLELSNRVRAKELHAFVEVGKDILHPEIDPDKNYIRYYSEHGFMDDVRYWFSNTINNYVRQLRLNELNLDPTVSKELFAYTNIDSRGLATVDKKTGEQQDAQKSSELQSFAIPYIVVILMFMLTMMSAIPLLTAVMEEKQERIAEVLLGTVTPFQFMTGKILGGIGIGLTVAAFYFLGGTAVAIKAGVTDMVPFHLLPWFFAYMFLFIIMVGAGMAALGSTCNDNKDAQSLQFPAMLPVILPLLIIMPVIQNPAGSFATTLALIPPFTPTIMMIRLATPVTIPMWQPVLGLFLVVLFTLFTVWVGARIFRTAILIQGQKPSVANLIKYAFKN